MHHALTLYPATHVAYVMSPAVTTRLLIRAGSLEHAERVAVSIVRQAHEAGTLNIADVVICPEVATGLRGVELEPVFTYVD